MMNRGGIMGNNAITQIQQALRNKGIDPGAIDGIWGRNTIAAVRQFQMQQGLEVDGIVGPQTTAALFKDVPSVIELLLPWFEEAKHLMGTKEVLGDKNNPVIMDWAKDLDINYVGDDIPWCGLFVTHCVGTTLQHEVLTGNPLGARQWERSCGFLRRRR